MFLREGSKAHGVPVNLLAVTSAATDPELPAGKELRAMADAVTLWDTDEIPIARDALIAAVGEAGAVRAIAVAGNYGMMNRVLDAVLNPISGRPATMAAELHIEWPRS
jgi:hypothetical protein